MKKKVKSSRIVNEIIKNFDFKKVHRTMLAINWQWISLKSKNMIYSVPTIRDLKKVSRDMLNELEEHTKYNKEISAISTGGLKASKSEWGMELSFILTDWSEEYSNGELRQKKIKNILTDMDKSDI